MEQAQQYWISSLGTTGFEEHCCWFCESFFTKLQRLQEEMSKTLDHIMYYYCADIEQLRKNADKIYAEITKYSRGGIFIIFDKKSKSVLYIGKSVKFTSGELWPLTQIIRRQENIVNNYIEDNSINLSIDDCSVFFLLLGVDKSPNVVLGDFQIELKKLLNPLVK